MSAPATYTCHQCGRRLPDTAIARATHTSAHEKAGRK